MENLTSEEFGLVALFAAIGITGMLLIILAWYVVQVIANWKIFKKMGEPGWKSIIPFYNSYILYKRTWKTMFFWIALVIGFIAGVFESLAQNAGVANTVAVFAAIELIFLIAAVVINIIEYSKLSKSFGHGAGFTLGLVFLNPIFKLILGFGSSQYIGNTTEQNQQ